MRRGIISNGRSYRGIILVPKGDRKSTAKEFIELSVKIRDYSDTRARIGARPPPAAHRIDSSAQDQKT